MINLRDSSSKEMKTLNQKNAKKMTVASKFVDAEGFFPMTFGKGVKSGGGSLTRNFSQKSITYTKDRTKQQAFGTLLKFRN